MRIDRKALEWNWRQTIVGTAVMVVFFLFLLGYFVAQNDKESAIWIAIFLLFTPVAFGIVYSIKKLITSIGDSADSDTKT